jgi:hypothetical protein
MDEPHEGEAPFDEEMETHAATPVQRCSVCRRQIVERDRARIRAEASDGPLIVTHVSCWFTARTRKSDGAEEDWDCRERVPQKRHHSTRHAR